jgi:hypothetical protein
MATTKKANAKTVKTASASKTKLKSAFKKGEKIPKLDPQVVGTSNQGVGTAQEQNKAYAKLARKYGLLAEVQELNGKKRKGEIVSTAAPGSGFVDVKFDGTREAKHVADLKLINKGRAVFKPKFKTGDRVSLTTGDKAESFPVEYLFIGDGVAGPLGVRMYRVNDTSMTEDQLVKAEKPRNVKPKFAADDVVSHPAHSMGRVVAVKENGAYDVFFEGENNSINDTIEVHQDELTLVTTAKKAAEARTRVAKQEAKEAKKARKFQRYDRVQESAGKKRIGMVVSTDPEGIRVQFDGSDVPVIVTSTSINKVKPTRVKFEAITLFGAFSAKDRTFVKVSKSNAIPAQVQGSTDEPFALLATPTAKIPNSSIQRFKKDDRVVPYAGPAQAQ